MDSGFNEFHGLNQFHKYGGHTLQTTEGKHVSALLQESERLSLTRSGDASTVFWAKTSTVASITGAVCTTLARWQHSERFLLDKPPTFFFYLMSV